MQADEFEKKIQNKMEGFELVPNSEVWEQVATRIDKEKKRRRDLFYWLFTGFILLAGTSAVWFINGENKNQALNVMKNNATEIENYKIKQHADNGSADVNNFRKNHFAKNLPPLQRVELKSQSSNQPKNNAFAKIASAKMINKESIVTTDKPDNNIYNTKKQKTDFLPPHRFYNPRLTTSAKADSLLTSNNFNAKTNLKKDALSNAKNQSDRKTIANNKWKIGFTIFSGISNNMSGLLIADKNYVPNDYSAAPASGTGNYSYSVSQYNNFKTGFSFGFGILAKKRFTQKISWSAGVNYHLYTAGSAAGNKVTQPRSFYDSALRTATAVNDYYAAGNSVQYSNKYQLVELPVNVYLTLNKNEQKPWLLSAGISSGYLVATNALYANSSANVYYADKQKFHRLLLSAHSGLSFPLAGSSRYLLSAGPVVQYSFTNIAKAVTGSRQHLFFAGIKASIVLK